MWNESQSKEKKETKTKERTWLNEWKNLVIDFLPFNFYSIRYGWTHMVSVCVLWYPIQRNYLNTFQAMCRFQIYVERIDLWRIWNWKKKQYIVNSTKNQKTTSTRERYYFTLQMDRDVGESQEPRNDENINAIYVTVYCRADELVRHRLMSKIHSSTLTFILRIPSAHPKAQSPFLFAPNGN